MGELPSLLLMAALGAIMVLDAIPLVGVLIPGDAAVIAAVGLERSCGGAMMLPVVAGYLLGWSVSFFAGRHLGERIRHGRIGAWIGEARWAAAERSVRRGGGRMVLLAPFLPVLNALLPLAAGGLRMSYRRFVACATAGAALWAGLYVLLAKAAQSVSGLPAGGGFSLLVTTGVGLLFGWVVLFGLRRQLRRQLGAQAR